MTSMPPRPPLDPTPVAIQSLDFIPDSNQELTNELTRLAGHINAAQYRFLKLLAALIQREAWGGGSGFKSPVHWLNYYCGIDFGAAREKVRVAKALQSLPQIDQAFASGAISYSKVRAMTRSATPANEADLLNVARYGTAQHVETLVRQHQRVKRLNRQDEAAGEDSDASDVGKAQHQARELSTFYDEDGMLVIKGRFAPEEGAVIVKALEGALDTIEQEENRRKEHPDVQAEEKPTGEKTFPQKRESEGKKSTGVEIEPDVSAETSSPSEPQNTFPQKRADALLRMAEHFLASDQQGSHSLSRPLTNGDKYQVLVHFDARSDSELRKIGMPAHLDDGPPLPETTFKRLACDASLIPVLRDDTGNVLNIGRKSRAVPPAIRRALKIRDSGCRYPGCCQKKYVDAHHIQHWCEGGETSLDNLVLLCRHHHRLLHDGVFSIEKANDKCNDSNSVLHFVSKHGKKIRPALYPQFDAPLTRNHGKAEIELGNEQQGLVIDAETGITLWQGERLDYGMAIEGLLSLDANNRAP